MSEGVSIHSSKTFRHGNHSFSCVETWVIGNGELGTEQHVSNQWYDDRVEGTDLSRYERMTV